MGFYDQMFGASPSLGGGAPSAFSSPGANPQMLAALMAMQQRGGMGGGMGGAGMNPAAGAASPQLPPPPGIAGAARQPAAMPAAPGPQANPMIAQLMANPMMLRQLLGGQQQQPNQGVLGGDLAAAANAVGPTGGNNGLFGWLGSLFGQH